MKMTIHSLKLTRFPIKFLARHKSRAREKKTRIFCHTTPQKKHKENDQTKTKKFENDSFIKINAFP